MEQNVSQLQVNRNLAGKLDAGHTQTLLIFTAWSAVYSWQVKLACFLEQYQKSTDRGKVANVREDLKNIYKP